MAEYYLMSQLPSLDAMGDNMPLPITEERFSELCHRFLGKRALAEFEKLTLLPSREYEKSSSPLIEAWNKGERKLRLALGKVRADKMKKPFDTGEEDLSTELIKIARMAVEAETPMEAEKFLGEYRMEFLETLKPMDNFALDSVFYYGIKLKLLLRAKKFDTQSGQTAYKNIYDSIMNGDRLEAE